MEFRKATMADYQEAVRLLEEGRRNIAKLGIDQWQNGSPSKEDLYNDIKNGTLYTIAENDKLLGINFLGEYEPDYDYIYWGSFKDLPYLVIHRVAVDSNHRGTGVFAQLIKNAEQEALKRGKKALRIDTHCGNTLMQRALKNNNFTQAGVIYLENGDQRVAFEKILY